MDKITLFAPAKLNLSLNVVSKRADGYHEMDMINTSVSLCDKITAELCETGVFAFGDTAKDGEDLCIKAAKVFFEETKLSCGAKITLQKNIPVLGGLGGGSADAAAVIRALNALCGANLGFDELNKIAVKIGADVPFCLWGKTARVQGVGQKITPLPDMFDCTFLLVKPGKKLSTAQMFEKLDNAGGFYHPDIDGAAKALQKGDINGFCKAAGNSFDTLWGNEAVKDKIIANGAAAALTTGSGPTVYGLFFDGEKADYCKKAFEKDNIPAWVCKPYKQN